MSVVESECLYECTVPATSSHLVQNDKPKSQSSLDVSLVAWTVTCGSVEQLVGTGGGRCRNTIVNGRSVCLSLIRAVARIYIVRVNDEP